MDKSKIVKTTKYKTDKNFLNKKLHRRWMFEQIQKEAQKEKEKRSEGD